jgi:hypothetical protein
MRPGFAGAQKPQPLKQTYCPIKSDNLQTQRFVSLSSFFLESLYEKSSHPGATVSGQEGDVDAANFVFTPLHNQSTGRLALNQNDLIHRILAIGLIKNLLGLVLKTEELTDAIFVPAQPAQIDAAAALVKFE